jgi:hypothetical protein
LEVDDELVFTKKREMVCARARVVSSRHGKLSKGINKMEGATTHISTLEQTQRVSITY